MNPAAKTILDILCSSSVGIKPDELKSRAELREVSAEVFQSTLDSLIKQGLVRLDKACHKHDEQYKPTSYAWAHL